MKKTQDKKQTVDKMIANLDKLLIEKGLKPTIPGNKKGSFVTIKFKTISTSKKEAKSNEKDIV